MFPNVSMGLISRRYYEVAAPRHLLFDGEQTFLTIAYTHRRLRLTSLFWAQPRFLRVGRLFFFCLRCYNVTEPRPRRLRTRAFGAVLGFSRLRPLASQHLQAQA